MKTTMTLAALAVAAATLGGCGGGGSSAPSITAPGGASSSSAAATPGSSGGPSSSASGGTGGGAAATVTDPCTVLDAGDIARLTRVEVKKGSYQAVGASKICNWLPKDGTKSDAAVFSAQEGPLPGPLTQVEGALKEQFKGTVTKLDVRGADDARYVTGKSSGLNVIDVLATRGGTFYQVVVATPRNAAQHKSDAITIVEALLKA